MLGGSGVKLAVIDFSLSIVMMAGLSVPVRSPLQPSNRQPGAGVAVSGTLVPAGKIFSAGGPFVFPPPLVSLKKPHFWPPPHTPTAVAEAGRPPFPHTP